MTSIIYVRELPLNPSSLPPCKRCGKPLAKFLIELPGGGSALLCWRCLNKIARPLE